MFYSFVTIITSITVSDQQVNNEELLNRVELS